MKILKICIYAIVGLLVLCVVALGAAVAIVDGAFVKSRLERYLK